MGESTYDLILVGSSFASAFFLHGFLERHGTTGDGRRARVLVVERGARHDHRWMVRNERHSDVDFQSTYDNRTPSKVWNGVIGFGGASLHWTGNVPRQMESDFETRTRYGFGRDWPFGYRALEPYYDQAERLIGVAGSETVPYPRNGPPPIPPHAMNDPDRRLAEAYPDTFAVLPSAKPTRPVDGRPGCCSTLRCQLCPIDAKFTVLNGFPHLWTDPRVTVLTDTKALAVEVEGGRATGVRVVDGAGRERVLRADLVGLGANALFNPHLLARSGLDHPLLGRRLHEQYAVVYRAFLRGMDNFQGSTMSTGMGFMLYDRPERRERSGCMLETHNRPMLRPERDRWRQVFVGRFVFEEDPSDESRVTVSSDDPERPEVAYAGPSERTRRGIAALASEVHDVLSPLPVERIDHYWDPPTEHHIQGTTVMGKDPADSVIDPHLVHHRVRNLVVLGSGAFPTGAASNPTLTLSALSLKAAAHV